MSVKLGRVPSAVITPVSKCTPISGHGDLRPISVTPILSQMVVKDHILPVIPLEVLLDEYGFILTGSMTAAIVNIIHDITILMESNKHVRCLLVDFSKVIDSVGHLAFIYYFIYLFIIGKYIPPTCANTSERLAGSRVWCLGPFSGFSCTSNRRLLSNAKSAA